MQLEKQKIEAMHKFKETYNELNYESKDLHKYPSVVSNTTVMTVTTVIKKTAIWAYSCFCPVLPLKNAVSSNSNLL